MKRKKSVQRPLHFQYYDQRLWPILEQAMRIKRRRDFSQVSPFAYRYVNTDLAPFTSEQARILYEGAVEASIALELEAIGECPRRHTNEIIRSCTALKAADVYHLEYGVPGRIRAIRHDVRALVQRIKVGISKAARRFVHLLATSCDTLNTADAARTRDATVSVLLPGLKKVESHFIRISRQYADTVQVGRTHLQHASPQTFGNTMTEYVVRLGGEIVKLEKEIQKLNGKFSGPVGTYGPSSLIVRNPMRFEKRLLAHLGLRPGRYSTQITMPEAMADVYHRLTLIMGIFADLGDSFRRLQSTEVAEVAQAKSTQGSSSIMAHKSNPISFENVKSLDKAMVGRMIGVYLDLISDHQRDLTNSASGRFHIEILEFIAAAIKVLNRVLPKLVVDEAQMMRNLNLTGDLIISDPLNTLLTYYGMPNAHRFVSRLCDESVQTKTRVWEIMKLDAHAVVWPYLKRMTQKQLQVLRHPRLYIGLAAKRTRKEADFWERRLKLAA